MLINEIFASIQGESGFAGLPCVFVRTTGCILDCRWCDTGYARQEGDELSLDEIMARVGAHGIKLVELTGGEPLAQADSIALLERMLEAGHTVLLETSGAMDIAQVPEPVHVIMDIKCPGSGMEGRFYLPNLEALKPHHEVKFVLASREDYDYARRMIAEHGLSDKAQVLLSTVFDELAPAKVVEWMLADGLDARFQLQMHKFIWPPEARGV